MCLLEVVEEIPGEEIPQIPKTSDSGFGVRRKQRSLHNTEVTSILEKNTMIWGSRMHEVELWEEALLYT